MSLPLPILAVESIKADLSRDPFLSLPSVCRTLALGLAGLAPTAVVAVTALIAAEAS